MKGFLQSKGFMSMGKGFQSGKGFLHPAKGFQLGTNPTPPQQVVTDAMITSEEGVSFYFASSDVGEENVYLQLS